jgi:hypothetical protein
MFPKKDKAASSEIPTDGFANSEVHGVLLVRLLILDHIEEQAEQLWQPDGKIGGQNLVRLTANLIGLQKRVLKIRKAACTKDPF